MSEMGMAMMGTGVARGEDRAREAAEAAVRSPLLEDVDLRGAKGILVNITAGLDLNLGEFTEVGNTIEEFASDNATVVIGTVIDPEMSDELKVTVVATGLGHDYRQQIEPTVKAVVNNTMRRATGDQMELPTGKGPLVDDAHMGSSATDAASSSEGDIGYLDIPAFLRRQAD
jgi:cell division protein FtsZ